MAMKKKQKKKGFGTVCYAAPITARNLQFISTVSSLWASTLNSLSQFHLSLSIIYNGKLNFLTLFVFVFSIIAFRKVNSENCYWTTIIWKCLEVAFFILFFYYNFIFLSCNHHISKFDSCLIYINFSYQFG